MMGRSHVAIAAAATAAAGTLAGLGPIELVLATAIGGGAGVGADADHPDATIAHTHWPVSLAVAHGVHALSEQVSGRGHRGLTHWLSTAVGIAVGIAVLQHLWPRWTMALLVGICGAWALRCSMVPHRIGGLYVTPKVAAPLLAALAGWAVYDLGSAGLVTARWLPAVVLLGWAVHPVCDAVTTERRHGLEMLRPFSRRRVGFGLLELGGRGEQACAILAGALAGILLVVPAMRSLGVV